MSKLLKKLQLWGPLGLVILMAPWSSWADLSIAQLFYKNGHFRTEKIYDLIFKYGTWPGFFLFITASIVLVGSYFKPAWRKWRQGALTLVITLLIGSGLITNGILKDHWGRPRPKQVSQFGGKQKFRPFYHPNFFYQSEPAKSFPSGHATMGYYFFALSLVGSRYKSKPVVVAGILMALGIGGALSWTRIAQGGHFFSDTIVSALIMWLTALTADRAFTKRQLTQFVV